MTVPQMTVLRNAGTLLPKVALLTGVLALAPLAAVTAASPDAGSEASSATVMPETGRLGPVRRYDAQGTPKDVVLLVSDADGWDSRAEDVANAVAASGRTVLGVDLKTFQAGMDKTDDACSYPVNDLEAISQQIQKDLPFSQYRPPALAGIGAGAALAYAAITESLPNTFLAGIGLDFCPIYLAPRPFCPDAPTTTSAEGTGRYQFGAAEKEQTPWAATPKPGCPADLTDAIMDHTPTAVRLDVRPAQWGSAVTEALDKVGEQGSASGTADIPVVEIPAETGAETVKGSGSADGDTLAIFWSGDGGWRDIDRQIGQELARSGVPVVGVDSLRYFWREQRPDAVARDLERMISHYTVKWDRSKVLLIGYSFGADILPSTINHLSEQSRSHIRLVSLLGFAKKADFEVGISGWLGVESSDAEDTLAEIAKLPPIPLQCVYGAEEDDTACTTPELERASKLRMDGGHHFDGNYKQVASAILDAAGAAR
jgi:type IV secretory pathway VirJ component